VCSRARNTTTSKYVIIILHKRPIRPWAAAIYRTSARIFTHPHPPSRLHHHPCRVAATRTTAGRGKSAKNISRGSRALLKKSITPDAAVVSAGNDGDVVVPPFVIRRRDHTYTGCTHRARVPLRFVKYISKFSFVDSIFFYSTFPNDLVYTSRDRVRIVLSNSERWGRKNV